MCLYTQAQLSLFWSESLNRLLFHGIELMLNLAMRRQKSSKSPVAHLACTAEVHSFASCFYVLFYMVFHSLPLNFIM